MEPVATAKLWGYPHFPHQREFCTEGLLGRHALGMLGRTLHAIVLLVLFLAQVPHPGIEWLFSATVWLRWVIVDFCRSVSVAVTSRGEHSC